jgi:hypothetical protein
VQGTNSLKSVSQSRTSSHVMSTQHRRDIENSVEARLLKNTRSELETRV